MPDIFLSYSREDQPIARRHAEALLREGFSVWWDQALNAGETFDKVTEKALKDAKAVVVLWSKQSVDSRWVRSEATQADRFGTLVPVTIEPCDRPIMFELMHTADLSNWHGDRSDARWRSFINGLRQFVERPAASPTIASALPAVATPVPARESRSSDGRPIIWITAVALIAVVAGLWLFHGKQVRTPASAAATAASAVTNVSIAVLPFKDLSEKHDQEYFADGVTEEILNTLAGIKDLTVTARTSAFAFKGKDVDLREVGKILGVANILEGSIRKDGEQLRITAQLIDAKTDAHLWSRTYDRPRQEVFKVQEEIAREVAQALQVTLGVGFGRNAGMTRNVEAYDAFLAANVLLASLVPDDRRRGIELLQQAVARDPDFAVAWYLLMNASQSMAGLVTEDPQAWLRKSDEAFAKLESFARDFPGLVEGILGERSAGQGRWKEAGEHFKAAAVAAAKLGDSSADSRGGVGFLVRVGRTREALALLEQEKARDPLGQGTALYLSMAHGATGNFPAAFAESERGYHLDGSLKVIIAGNATVNAFGARDRAQIIRWMEATSAATSDPATHDFNNRMRSLLDRPAEALAWLRPQASDPSAPAFSRIIVAAWLPYFGDTQTTLETLRYAFEHGAPGEAAFSLWYPAMRDVRKTPGFRQLVRDMGLVEYWKEFGWSDYCKPTTGDDFDCH